MISLEPQKRQASPKESPKRMTPSCAGNRETAGPELNTYPYWKVFQCRADCVPRVAKRQHCATAGSRILAPDQWLGSTPGPRLRLNASAAISPEHSAIMVRFLGFPPAGH